MVKKLLCLCMAVFALVACGCGSDKSDTSQNAGQAYAVITDDTGKTVTLDKKPQRVVEAVNWQVDRRLSRTTQRFPIAISPSRK